jgi:hypothetical protein
MNLWLAAFAAVIVQPLVFLLRIAPAYIASPEPFYGMGFMLLATVAVAAAVVLVLGIPAFLALRRFHRDGWGSLALTGLFLGAVPVAFSWPGHLEGFSAGQNWHGKYVQTYINGSPTSYAWLTYSENVAFFALHGLVGALVFYIVWRWGERPNNRLERTRGSSSVGDGGTR